MNENRLVFVYNADGGLFNTATDIAHKILSPETYSCNLCALTHGYFSVKKDWIGFLGTLPLDCDFLHRDEFSEKYAGQPGKLPVVFLIKDTKLEPLLLADEINRCETLEQLKTLIKQKLDGV